MSGVQQLNIVPDDDGMRLDRWLRRHFQDVPQARLEALLRRGDVRVDGRRVRANARLTAGQIVRVPPLSPVRPAIARSISPRDADALRAAVIYEDARVIVLNKPPGLAVQGGSRTPRHVDALSAALVDARSERPRLVHRLDKETSGLLVLARTRTAAAELAAQFRSRAVRKLYWAIVCGAPQPASGQIGEPIIADDIRRTALTRYRTIARDETCSWLALIPHTGRKHQLRAHLAGIGCPLVGDGKYRSRQDNRGAGVGLCLHARRMWLPGPGDEICVSAPLPTMMAGHMARLRFDAATAGADSWF